MDPLTEYSNRRERWRAEQRRLQRLFIRIGNWRLAIAVFEALLAWFVWGKHALNPWLLVDPAAAFVALFVWHQRVIRRRTLAERAIHFYNQRCSKVDGTWVGNGSAGERFRDPEHIYSEDLDLFGKGSLFELIAATRTAAAENLLARWLRAPADRNEALARQEAVRELSSQLDLREDVALLGEDIRAEVDVEVLERWGEAPPIAFPSGARWAALILSVLAAAATIAFFDGAIPPWPLLALLACNFLFIWITRKRVAQISKSVDTPAQGLRILSLILQRLEAESFTAPRLRELRAQLATSGVTASKRIARLQRLMDWFDSRDHVLVRVLEPILLWREQLAIAIEAWRCANGRGVAAWTRAVAEIEALSSFGALAFEQPHWNFPLLSANAEIRLAAKSLRHPLLPSSRSVPNDVDLGSPARLLIVSGSNMSGKSTLLRSIGLNTVLAWAGAPVAAACMETTLLHTAASIRVTDSLQENRSRFYAEILRIGRIVALAGRGEPVLFLLDELLSGTNSHDRRIGAAAIVRRLVTGGAIGLITTHDLALADIQQELGARAENVHFDDQIVNGEITFDYRLRPGVVTHSNALELMRAVGLEL